MKLLMPIFLISLVISLVLGLAMFVADTFTFLASQAFYEIYDNSGIVVAILEVIAGVVLFSSAAFVMIKSCLTRVVNSRVDNNKTGALQFGSGAKFLVGFILYELLKIYLKKLKK